MTDLGTDTPANGDRLFENGTGRSGLLAAPLAIWQAVDAIRAL